MTKLHRNIPLIFMMRTMGSLSFDRGIFILYLFHAGLSEVEISTLQMVIFLMIMIFEVPSGLFADSHGRKSALIISCLSMAIYALGMLFAQDFWLFVILFSIQALSFSMLSGADTALFYDTLKALKRRDAFVKLNARLMTVGNLSLAFGLAMGGWLQSVGGWTLVYLSFFTVNILSFLIVAAMSEPPMDASRRAGSIETTRYFEKVQSYRQSFQEPAMRRLLGFILAFAIFDGLLTPLYIYAQKLFASRGLSVSEIGLVYGAVELISAGMFLLAPFFNAHIGARRFFMFSIAFSMAAMVFLMSAEAWVVVCAFVILFSLPEARRPLHEDYLNARIRSQLRASLISTESMIESFLLIFIYLYYGFAMSHFDVGWVMVSTVVLCPVVLMILWVYFQNPSPEIDVEKTTR